MQTIHLIGNAHLDPVWLWQWPQGLAEIKATYQSALDRIDEDPEFIFTTACAAYHAWVEANCPEMFARIRQRVDEGRWRIVGGWWIQPDCNLPCGESFARQSLLSQRYFHQHLGVIARVGYNVDSFGHSGALPQILRQSGMDAYVMMRPSAIENPDIPADTFLWQGLDGTCIPTFRIPNEYGTWGRSRIEGVDPDTGKLMDSAARAQAAAMPTQHFYGVGNHGGGPTRRTLARIHAYRREHPEQRVVFSHPEAFFAEAASRSLPTYGPELQHHASGCYSATSLIKALNRDTENRLLRAERLCVLASRLMDQPYPASQLGDAWQALLFNQFHDILGGCAIQPAYEDARRALDHAGYIADQAANAALQRISWAIDTSRGNPVLRSKEDDWCHWESHGQFTPTVVFNPHPFPVTAPVTLFGRITALTDDAGAPQPFQTVRASRTNGQDKFDSLLLAQVPPMGWAVYWSSLSAPSAASAQPVCRAQGDLLENDRVRLSFDPDTGALVSLVRKDDGRELLKAPSRALVVDESAYDTWAHNEFAFRQEVGVFGQAQLISLAEGPLMARLRVVTRYQRSTLTADYTLYAGDEQVEVAVTLDFQEALRMVKLSLPLALEDSRTACQQPYGFIVRPDDGREQPGQSWIDVSGRLDGAPAGLAVISPGKYGYDMQAGELRLTLARGAYFADHYGQQQRDETCVVTDQGVQRFTYALLPHGGDFRQGRVPQRAAVMNQPPLRITETYHTGPLPAVYSAGPALPDGLELTALKQAEDGDGIIARIQEIHGAAFAGELTLLGASFSVRFAPLQVQSFRIRGNAAEPTDLLEGLTD